MKKTLILDPLFKIGDEVFIIEFTHDMTECYIVACAKIFEIRFEGTVLKTKAKIFYYTYRMRSMISVWKAYEGCLFKTQQEAAEFCRFFNKSSKGMKHHLYTRRFKQELQKPVFWGDFVNV